MIAFLICVEVRKCCSLFNFYWLVGNISSFFHELRNPEGVTEFVQ